MKRGISVLISGVLLILLVVTISIIIYRFTEKTTTEGFEKGENVLEGFQNCDEVKFTVEDVSCDNGVLKVKINNEKNIDFRDGFALRFFYSTGSEEEIGSFLYNTRLDAYEVDEIIAVRSGKPEGISLTGKELISYDEINAVEVVPKVKAGNTFQFCNDQKQKIEVKDCQKQKLAL